VLLRAFEAGTCGDGVASQTAVLMAGLAALVVGALSANWLSNRVDAQLLRAAARRAAESPAAHPETVAAMEAATPSAVFDCATRLVGPYRRRPQV
jgi:hypothetical protein